MPDSTVISVIASAVSVAACLVTLFQKSRGRSSSRRSPMKSVTTQDGSQTTIVTESPKSALIYANRVIVTGRNSGSEAFLHFGQIAEGTFEARDGFSVAVNVYTAKRFLAALKMAIDRHEQAFGPIDPAASTTGEVAEETDRVGYANFAQVSSTPEELIVDLALNKHPYRKGEVEVDISHTVVMLHNVAKQLSIDLSRYISQFESHNGPVETDVRERVIQ